jgi:probable HAF family extracellular repeat protein
MNVKKFILLTLIGPALVAQISLAQTTTKIHDISELARRVMAPLRLGPYATVPNPLRKQGRSAVELGLATAKTYKFASADYPGAGLNFVFDENLTTILGDTDFSFLQGFTLKGNNYQLLSLPGSQDSEATGINTSGQIVGLYRDVGGTLHGFIYSAGVVTNIDNPSAPVGNTTPGGLNDAGEIVGSYIDSANVTHGFSTPDGVNFTAIDCPGAVSTIATGVNTAGDISGQFTDAFMNIHGFLLRAGVFTTINFPLATFTVAIGINDSDEIAGYFTDTSNVNHGFIYSANAFFQVDVAGATQTQLTRIKNNGHITGVYIDNLGANQHGLTGH